MTGVSIAQQRRYFFRLNANDIAARRPHLASVLHPLLGQARARSAVVYQADPGDPQNDELSEFRAVAAAALAGPRIPQLGVTIGEHATRVLRCAAEVFQISQSEDQEFANLPEILQYGLKRVLLIPLRNRDSLLGYLTVGRAVDDVFNAASIAAAEPIAGVATALLERDLFEAALKDRKLIERAKGIVQRRRRMSEEDAYLFLRNQSRRLRRSMAEIAEELINEALLRKTA